MVIGTIDFPQEVIDAQRDGRLVVFAGAGVSIPRAVALDASEVANMALWPVYIRNNFAEAIDLLGGSPKFNLMMVDIKKDITAEYKTNCTNATGNYINLLLGALHRGDYQIGEIRDLLEELIEIGLSEEIVRKIRDSLTSLE